jgi:hypothetical protein
LLGTWIRYNFNPDCFIRPYALTTINYAHVFRNDFDAFVLLPEIGVKFLTRSPFIIEAGLGYMVLLTSPPDYYYYDDDYDFNRFLIKLSIGFCF